MPRHYQVDDAQIPLDGMPPPPPARAKRAPVVEQSPRIVLAWRTRPRRAPASPCAAPRVARPAQPAAPQRPNHGPPRLAVANLAPPPLPPGVGLPRRWALEVEALDGPNAGKVRLSVPIARGEALVVRPNPTTMWAALQWARNATAVAGVARWQGRRTEMDALTDADDPTEPARAPMPTPQEIAARGPRKVVSWGRDATVRPDQHNPAEWTPNPPETADGKRTWTSPGGKRYGSRRILESVIEKRAALGLPTCWEEHVELAQRGAAGTSPPVGPSPPAVPAGALVDLDALAVAR